MLTLHACVYAFILVLQSRPLLSELANLITPNYAAKWREMGLLLDLTKGKLDIIKQDYCHSAENCCNQMWGIWLDRCTTATWKDVLNVLDHENGMESEEGMVKKVIL